ncbi:hypothetical protein PGT21_026486 [Puccinia graminis f. sp. tritici]|uniref:Uncharacterized protein n=1 Tax=Puccinia graminis f. sp. tritici TaxID=56615 RepID=A0A5B0PEB5_PUCGR|nr:hypothetical protein PGT21_026486 [Puccinia graminis f. sp. tritici]KAA1112225.1 hypothetical protein PGTUg99_003642 [Puccinia graminis f. sp. tritici]KAA1123427.1 hypothetical protein PGTUg99_002007 [Puccinia graminis f. sp. tritici]
MFATSHEPSRIWRVLPVQVLLACQVDCMPPTSAIRELVNGGSMPPETQHQAWIAASPGLAEGRVVMDPIPCKSHHSLTCPLAEGAFSKAPTHQYLAPAGLLQGEFRTASLIKDSRLRHRFQVVEANSPSRSPTSPTEVPMPVGSFLPYHMQAAQFDDTSTMKTYTRYVVNSAPRPPPLRREDSYYSYMPPDVHMSYGWTPGQSTPIVGSIGISHVMTSSVRTTTKTKKPNPLAEEFTINKKSR